MAAAVAPQAVARAVGVAGGPVGVAAAGAPARVVGTSRAVQRTVFIHAQGLGLVARQRYGLNGRLGSGCRLAGLGRLGPGHRSSQNQGGNDKWFAEHSADG